MYRGLGSSTEMGLLNREQAQKKTGLNQLMSMFSSIHGPSAMEANYDVSRRGQDLEQVLTNQKILSSDYFSKAGREFETEQSALDRQLIERGQDKGIETARASKPPWWSYLIPF